MEFAAIIVAAGRGTRMGGAAKQYRMLGGRTILARSIAAMTVAPVEAVQCVIGAGDEAVYAESIAGLSAPLLPPVAGGADRQASVLAGLEALAMAAPTYVMIHDAARPFVSPAVIADAVAAMAGSDAAIPVVPVVDTIKRIVEGRVAETLERAALGAVQTPQVFRFTALLDAHRAAAAAGMSGFSDDAALIEWAGGTVSTFAGDPMNTKLTTEADFHEADRRLGGRTETRSATGYDVHAFAPGDHVWLGGVRIAHDHALVGHSDADVVLHALTDALLGTVASADIGAHFPPSEDAWRGAASHIFLERAVAEVAAVGGRILHLDATIVCEAPKIGPHRDAMRARIAEIAGIDIGRVSVKATTSERLGFTGRREGIAALATATIERPATP